MIVIRLISSLPQKYRGLSFLNPLLDRMTSTDPSHRPPAIGALALFQSCRNRVFSFTLYRRLSLREQDLVPRAFLEGRHLTRRITSPGRLTHQFRDSAKTQVTWLVLTLSLYLIKPSRANNLGFFLWLLRVTLVV